MKKLGILVIPFLLAIFVLNGLGLNAYAAETKTVTVPEKIGNEIYVQDHANLLSNEEKQEIITLGKKLDAASKAQIAILTVNIGAFEDVDTDSFANEALRTYGIGDKKLNNGILIVRYIGTKDGKKAKRIRYEVGYGLEGALPDGKIMRLSDDYGKPYFEKGEDGKGLTEMYKAIFNEVAKEYKLGDDFATKPVKGNVSSGSKIHLPAWAIVLIVIGVLILIYLDFRYLDGLIFNILINLLPALLSGGRGGGGGSNGGGGSSGGGGGSRDY